MDQAAKFGLTRGSYKYLPISARQPNLDTANAPTAKLQKTWIYGVPHIQS
jgi:hypothetical protein